MSYQGETMVHIHRVTSGDYPAISTFNGVQYKASDGWVPRIMGRYMSITSGTMSTSGNGMVGLNFRVNAAGFWELYGDVLGAIESWRIDLSFTHYSPSVTTITTYGVLN